MLVSEVQNLDIISVNIWQILISLINLLLLFLIIKKFLYKPVKKFIAQRKASVDSQYAEAELAKQQAEESRLAWEKRLEGAQGEADAIIDSARSEAKQRAGDIIAAADDKAAGIMRRAEADAQLEVKKARASIKDEIVDVSTQLAEKMLGREIKAADHRELIDSFLDGIDDASGIGGSDGSSR